MLDVRKVCDVAEAVAQHGDGLVAEVPALDRDDLRRGVRRRFGGEVMVAEAPLPDEDLLVGVGVGAPGYLCSAKA